MNTLIKCSIILLIFIAGYMLSKWIGRLLGVEGVDPEETEGRKVFIWGNRILFGIYLVIIFRLGIVNEQEVPESYLLFFVAALWLFKALVEWKYIKDSKQYIRTMIEILLIMIAVPLVVMVFSHFQLI